MDIMTVQGGSRMSQEGDYCHKMGIKILLTSPLPMYIIQIKGCSWGVQTALLLFPTFQKMEPGSIVRLCHAPAAMRQGTADAGGRAPTCFNSG